MEVSFWLVSLPALISLSLKGGIYLYAHYSRTHNLLTRLYLLTLFAFSIQNIAEVAHFYTLIERGVTPNFEVNTFYAASIAAYAFLFHLSLALAFNAQDKTVRRFADGVYVYAVLLEALLLFTPWLIAGYSPIGGYTVTRIPGPLYWAFELYVIATAVSAIGILAYGMKGQRSGYRKAQLKIVLIAMVPLNLVAIGVLVALHTGVRLFNASVTMPIALTFFLLLTAYATHQYRPFDIEFFIPWSKVRKRKSAFYQRIQAMIAEVAELRSVKEMLENVAQVLHCQVALIGGPRPLVALVKGQQLSPGDLPLSRFPRQVLEKVDHIVVVNEIADRLPELHGLMKQHKVGAIVPFNAHAAASAHWMLFGEHFSDHVYTPLDFKMVETLFERISERFLDNLLVLRTRLADADADIRNYKRRIAVAWEELTTLRRRVAIAEDENRKLREENSRLRRQRLRVVRSQLPEAIASGKKTLERYLAECEAEIVTAALKATRGDKLKAARLLGIWPNTLRYIMERHGLEAGSHTE
ncbi:MAG: helix-turn-helix domain-containing protein [Sulfurifustis sp.]